MTPPKFIKAKKLAEKAFKEKTKEKIRETKVVTQKIPISVTTLNQKENPFGLPLLNISKPELQSVIFVNKKEKRIEIKACQNILGMVETKKGNFKLTFMVTPKLTKTIKTLGQPYIINLRP